MSQKIPKMPRSAANVRLRKAARRLRRMSDADKIQLLVKAGLLSQADADAAKERLASGQAPEPDQVADPAQ